MKKSQTHILRGCLCVCDFVIANQFCKGNLVKANYCAAGAGAAGAGAAGALGVGILMVVLVLLGVEVVLLAKK
jgi:hypothetical protein